MSDIIAARAAWAFMPCARWRESVAGGTVITPPAVNVSFDLTFQSPTGTLVSP
jgi:hypothetical protein